MWSSVGLRHFEGEDLPLADADDPELSKGLGEPDLKVEYWQPLVVAEVQASEDALAVEGVELALLAESKPDEISIAGYGALNVLQGGESVLPDGRHVDDFDFEGLAPVN